MTADAYVDQLFSQYESTPELDDFKAEVLSNLLARIADLEAAGSSPDAAFRTATDELGDVGALAAQMSRQRTQDVFSQLYLHQKVRPNAAHIAGYVVLGAALVVGLVIGAILALTATPVPVVLLALDSTVLVALPIGGLVAVGLTQETAASLPLPAPRALGYGAATFLVLAGLLTAGTVLLADSARWPIALAFGLPAVLLGASLATVLGLTQTNRKKPWVHQANAQTAASWSAAVPAQRWARFGLYVAALWLLAIAAFFVLGFAVGFQYSWTVGLVALAAMFVLVAWAMNVPSTKDK